MKAIYILWLRQLKRYVRSKQRMFASLAQPVLFLLAFGFGFGSVFAKAGEGNYMQFLASGIICMAIMFTAVFSGIEIIWDKQFGFLKETLVAPVSRFNIMLGRTLGGATVAVIQGIIVLLITLLVGFKPNWSGFPLAFIFMFLLSLFFTAFGTMLASKLDDMQSFPLIINFLVMPLFFLSGALFPLTGLPGVFTTIVRFNPLSYAVDGIRGALTGAPVFGFGLDALVLCAVTFICLWVGAEFFKRIQA